MHVRTTISEWDFRRPQCVRICFFVPSKPRYKQFVSNLLCDILIILEGYLYWYLILRLRALKLSFPKSKSAKVSHIIFLQHWFLS